MKKLILMALFVLAVTPMAFAEDTFNILNAELDAPKLIGLKQISPDLFLGVSVDKPVAENLFHSSFAGIEDDQNYIYTTKITYYGCWLNCSEK